MSEEGAVVRNIAIINYPRHKQLTHYSPNGFLTIKKWHLSELYSFLTPTEKFFIRSHHRQPQYTKYWELKLSGCFKNTIILPMSELMKFPEVTRVCTFECSGNKLNTTGKSLYTNLKRLCIHYASIMTRNKLLVLMYPNQWRFIISLLRSTGIHTGCLIGTAQFTGVKLFDVLDKLPLAKNAKELVFEGMDSGYDNILQHIKGSAESFARSWNIEELRQYEPILCYRMNGQPLTAEHGYPLRLVIPAIYGSEQIKWLHKIIAIPDEFKGYYQQEYYGHKIDGKMVPVHEMRPKAMVMKVSQEKKQSIVVYGIVTRGLSPIDYVQIKLETKNKYKFNPKLATFTNAGVDYAWRFWEFEMPKKAKGKITIIPRAYTVDGECQPLEPDKHSIVYGANAVVPAIINL